MQDNEQVVVVSNGEISARHGLYKTNVVDDMTDKDTASVTGPVEKNGVNVIAVTSIAADSSLAQKNGVDVTTHASTTKMWR